MGTMMHPGEVLVPARRLIGGKIRMSESPFENGACGARLSERDGDRLFFAVAEGCQSRCDDAAGSVIQARDVDPSEP